MEDRLISLKAAIDAIYRCTDIYVNNLPILIDKADAYDVLDKLPSVTPKAEQTEYIPDTKAIPSEKDCVDLSERVTATFYDDEYEEWSQKTVTIRDVLDSVCDEYTVLPSVTPKAQQRWIPCDWCAYNPPSSMDGKPCTVCPAVANPEPYREEGENQ